MISELHELGFKVMLWITPFCDRNATIYQYGIDQHYWVLNKTTIQPNPSTTNPNKRDSSSSSPYLIKWWENNITGSAVLDVTNPLAVSWFTERLKQLKDTYQIDGFKLDAGETIYIPPITDPNAYYYNNSVFLNKTQPLIYTQLYASKICIGSLNNIIYNHMIVSRYMNIISKMYIYLQYMITKRYCTRLRRVFRSPSSLANSNESKLCSYYGFR